MEHLCVPFFFSIFAINFNYMKKNTVILDIEVYNDLRDFKENHEAGNICEIHSYTSNYQFMGKNSEIRTYISDDDVIKKITKINNENKTVIDLLLNKNQKLTTENKKLVNDVKILNKLKLVWDGNAKDIDNLSKMSILDFIKWRRQNKPKNII